MTARTLSVVAGVVAIVTLSCAAAFAHDPRADRPKRSTATSGVSLPLVTSPNVRVVDSFPETLGISGDSADLVRGLDVFEVDVPSKDLSASADPLASLP